MGVQLERELLHEIEQCPGSVLCILRRWWLCWHPALHGRVLALSTCVRPGLLAHAHGSPRAGAPSRRTREPLMIHILTWLVDAGITLWSQHRHLNERWRRVGM